MPAILSFEYYRTLINGIAGAVSATSLGGIFERLYRAICVCPFNSQETCNERIAQDFTCVSIAFAWTDVFFKWWRFYRPESRFPTAWDLLVDVGMLWSLYLNLITKLVQDWWGESEELSDVAFSSSVVLTLMLAVSTNMTVRRWIKSWLTASKERHSLEAYLDGLFEFARGVVDGSGLVSLGENVYIRYYNRYQSIEALTMRLLRYGTGVVWGIFAGLVGYLYQPLASTADLFPPGLDDVVEKILAVVNGLLPAIGFGLLRISGIVQAPPPCQLILSLGFALLLPVNHALALYVWWTLPQPRPELSAALLSEEQASDDYQDYYFPARVNYPAPVTRAMPALGPPPLWIGQGEAVPSLSAELHLSV